MSVKTENNSFRYFGTPNADLSDGTSDKGKSSRIIYIDIFEQTAYRAKQSQDEVKI